MSSQKSWALARGCSMGSTSGQTFPGPQTHITAKQLEGRPYPFACSSLYVLSPPVPANFFARHIS